MEPEKLLIDNPNPIGTHMTELIHFPWEGLRDAAISLCKASGSPEGEANLVASRLLKSNLVGHDSHGLIRLSMYMEWIRKGMIVPGATPELAVDKGGIALVNGNRGYGQTIAERTMEIAIERGRAHGVAAIGVTNLAHIGRLADYVISAARAGLVGMVFTSTGGYSKIVAPFGGKSGRMSTNPIAMALPSDREHPIVFDMATSAYAEGKFRVFRDTGRSAPENLLLDKEGHPTTNPDDFFNGGTILPLGGEQGYKGYLLNFMVEALGGLLTGGGYMGRDENPLFNNCSLMITIDVEAFRAMTDFKGDLEGLLHWLKDSPTHPGDEVLLPGEKEVRMEAERMRNGVPLAPKTVEALQAELDRYGVELALNSIALNAPTP